MKPQERQTAEQVQQSADPTHLPRVRASEILRDQQLPTGERHKAATATVLRVWICKK
jgi:hypothetical protein